MINAQSLASLQGAGLDEIRRYVRSTLEATPSYGQLAPDERKEIAQSMVHVLGALTDPTAGKPQLAAAARRQDRGVDRDVARALETRRLAQAQKTAGQDFQGGANAQAGQTLKSLVDAVDFPRFVSSLIEGVFTSIVDSSIRQMHEFGKFLNSVAMTLKEFAQENVDLDEGRDYLAGKYPKALKVEKSKLQRVEGIDDAEFPDFKSIFGLQDDLDLDDEESEQKIAESAQLQLARMRQQQLATMVLMGINRIVVTEGEIKATVQFDVSAKDTVHRDSHADQSDTQTAEQRSSAYAYQRNRSFWGTSRSGSGSNSSSVNTQVRTDNRSQNETSDSKLESKAKLTGFVQVKFKSETFPLERMASPAEQAELQAKAAK